MSGVVMVAYSNTFSLPDVIEQLQDMLADGALGVERYEMTLVTDFTMGGGIKQGMVSCEVRISVMMPGDWRPGKKKPDEPTGPIIPPPRHTRSAPEGQPVPKKQRRRSDAAIEVFGAE